MSRLDPIFALPSRPREYLESVEFLKVRIAEAEDAIDTHTAAALELRREIPLFERQAAEHERDAAIAKLKLIELQAEAERRRIAEQ